ncbi:hypothetical protein D9758_007968 [Tetrapyrgos nigripes]|uniref:Potassium transporter n=1 Tax=Tetrapyrgos nigripes TaxID=182062 RepID=A0A8H5FX47_9AGAR|nr:hypothetical protein D9758_007968 [Tetrapyrgos nigripes]
MSQSDDPTALNLPLRGNFVSRCFGAIKNYILYESTFFRLHLTAFTFIPLITSAIFWGCNGRFKVSYLDSLFLCYSAMTVTGLSTVNLSTLTAWQQVILYLLMMIGDITTVSWIMLLVRKEYFKRKCEWEYVKNKKKPKPNHKTTLASIFFRQPVHDPEKPAELDTVESPAPAPAFNLIGPTPNPTMLRNPKFSNALGLEVDNEKMNGNGNGATEPLSNHPEYTNSHQEPMLSDADMLTSSPQADSLSLSPVESRPGAGVSFARSTSFATSQYGQDYRRRRSNMPMPRRNLTILTTNMNRQNSLSGPGVHQHTEGIFGGFPGPFRLFRKFAKRAAPQAYRKIERKLTMPYTTTIESHNTPWLTGDATITIGRNSDIQVEELPDEVIEQIGGAEYKALRWLSYLVPMYFVSTQLISYILFAPWLSTTHQYDSVFESQFRLVSKPWFSLFQVMGAYTGGGLSLVDMGMLPFQTAYLITIAIMFAILAGNHALPIFLRFIIWIGFKIAPPKTDAQVAFDFLLHHPRRCFIYLFPSHQTWFLVFCLVGFSAIELVFFEILNIGLPAYESLSTGARIICGLFQGLAARASGFSIVPLRRLPLRYSFSDNCLRYRYHLCVLQVALSIRSTNVYEERSLGVFEPPPDDEDEEPEELKKYEPRQRIGRYLGWHLRRQMSIDIWWLVWAVFLIAIIERGNIMNEDIKWFDLFRILFELVSAFGGIGLSLGLPTDNFSFAGALKPLSKLIIIVIMVRGRHRGLPVRVDRAVMLPSELVKRENPQPAQNPNTVTET